MVQHLLSMPIRVVRILHYLSLDEKNAKKNNRKCVLTIYGLLMAVKLPKKSRQILHFLLIYTRRPEGKGYWFVSVENGKLKSVLLTFLTSSQFLLCDCKLVRMMHSTTLAVVQCLAGCLSHLCTVLKQLIKRP